MTKLSLTRRRILEAMAAHNEKRDGCLPAFDIFRIAFSDYSTGPRWAAKKHARLSLMAKHGLVEAVGVTFKNERTWRITDAGRELIFGGAEARA